MGVGGSTVDCISKFLINSSSISRTSCDVFPVRFFIVVDVVHLDKLIKQYQLNEILNLMKYLMG